VVWRHFVKLLNLKTDHDSEDDNIISGPMFIVECIEDF
jgi:hypothetical protein